MFYFCFQKAGDVFRLKNVHSKTRDAVVVGTLEIYYRKDWSLVSPVNFTKHTANVEKFS